MQRTLSQHEELEHVELADAVRVHALGAVHRVVVHGQKNSVEEGHPFFRFFQVRPELIYIQRTVFVRVEGLEDRLDLALDMLATLQ